MKHTEEILVAKRNNIIHLATVRHGITAYSHSDLEFTIDMTQTEWRVRNTMEDDPEYKQIIPYCVIRKGNKYLTYARAKGSGETRLLGSRSLGFGGHIDAQLFHDNTVSGRISEAANRELEEEIGLLGADVVEGQALGIINNDKDAVGEVHIGIYLEYIVSDNWEPKQREAGVADLQWLTLDELCEYSESYEMWSQMLISHIEKQTVTKRQRMTPALGMHEAQLAGVLVPQAVDGVEMSAEESIAHYARVSNPNNQLNIETSHKLIKYLIINSHWSPLDMVSMTVKLRTSRSVMAQVLRHWSFRFQEFSQRYSEVSEFDYSKVEARMIASGGNRQGSAGVCDDTTEIMQEMCHERAHQYTVLSQEGIAPECARDILPLATPTTAYMTGSVRSWVTYFWQRLCPHAQKEHRDLAWSIFSVFEKEFPYIADIVLNHRPVVTEIDWSSTRPAPLLLSSRGNVLVDQTPMSGDCQAT